MSYVFVGLNDNTYFREEIVEFREQCFPGNSFDDIADERSSYLFYLSNDNEIRSMARVLLESNCALVEYLAVFPDFENTGLATQLLLECERMFGVFHLELTVDCPREFRILNLIPVCSPYFSDGIKFSKLGCIYSFVFQSDSEDIDERECKMRFDVFVREEGFSAEEEMDEYEAESIHCIMIRNNEAVACCRFRSVGEDVRIERFAVKEPYRKRRIGTRLMDKIRLTLCGKANVPESIKSKIAEMENRTLIIHSELHCIKFYETEGFRRRGEQFMECGAAHQEMFRNQ